MKNVKKVYIFLGLMFTAAFVFPVPRDRNVLERSQSRNRLEVLARSRSRLELLEYIISSETSDRMMVEDALDLIRTDLNINAYIPNSIRYHHLLDVALFCRFHHFYYLPYSNNYPADTYYGGYLQAKSLDMIVAALYEAGANINLCTPEERLYIFQCAARYGANYPD